MKKALFVLTCLCIGVAAVLTATGCASLPDNAGDRLVPMVAIGGHDITFVSHTFDGTYSAWTYNVTSGTKPSLSHWVIEWCDEEIIKDASEEWEYVDGKPPTGMTGIKFDTGYTDGENRTVWFKLTGDYPEGLVGVATFGGGVASYGSVTGPLCEPVTQYELTLAAEPEIGGTATDLTGTSPYAEGTKVNIRAEPAEGYQFVIWAAPTGEFVDETATETIFSMPAQNVTVTAHFEEIPPVQYNLTISSTTGGSATITINPVIVIGPGETKTIFDIPAGTMVHLEASPHTGYEFVKWTGDPIDGIADMANAITMQDNYEITASFKALSEPPVTPPIAPPDSIVVGWEASPVNKLAILTPWIALFTALIAGTASLALKRRA